MLELNFLGYILGFIICLSNVRYLLSCFIYLCICFFFQKIGIILVFILCLLCVLNELIDIVLGMVFELWFFVNIICYYQQEYNCVEEKVGIELLNIDVISFKEIDFQGVVEVCVSRV